MTLVLQKANRIAFAEVADYDGACLAGIALEWYAMLDDDAQRSWKDLRLAILKQLMTRSGGLVHPRRGS